MVRVGLVGLPNAGKSTLFNFLTSANALVADYPFSTVTPNKSNLKLYDEDLLALAKAVKAPDILHTEIEVWDIAGLIENASHGEGLGNEFLGQIKDCGALIHVVRARPGDRIAQLTDSINTVMTEIALFDHKCLLNPFEKTRRLHRLYPKDAHYQKLDKILSQAYYGTKDGLKIADILEEDKLAAIQDLGLISPKPRIVLLNVDGDGADDSMRRELKADIAGNILELAALASMTEEERQLLGYSSETLRNFLQRLSEQLIHKIQAKRFYTVGHLGVGQWLAPEEATAQACARLMHAELSETIHGVKVAQLADFIKLKDWPQLVRHGLVKKYGASYVPRDKDILYFETA